MSKRVVVVTETWTTDAHSDPKPWTETKTYLERNGEANERIILGMRIGDAAYLAQALGCPLVQEKRSRFLPDPF